MNLQFKPRDRQPVAEENVYLDSGLIGTVKQDTRYDKSICFVACIDYPGRLPGDVISVGTGNTREEAVTKAIESGIKSATKALQELTILWSRLS